MHLVLAAWYSPENWPYIAMAVLGLGLVIFVHELGHFLAAKMCGVKCEKFYVGFDVPIKLGWGKYAIRLPASLWRKTWGETEYGIGIIPLGGYVKMLGQDDNPGRQAEMMREAHEKAERDQTESAPSASEKAEGDENFVFDPRSYMAQSVLERMFIISAGVMMNLIFAFIFAFIAFRMGVPYTKCDVAYVSPGEPAWLANLRPGDKIVEINGVKSPRFKDLQQEVILGDIDKGIPLTVERTTDGETHELEFVLKPHKDKIAKRKRAIIGVAMKRTLQLADEKFVLPGSPAEGAKASLQGGDTIVEVDGQPIEDYTEYLAALARNPEKALSITVQRNKPANGKDEAEVEKVVVQIEPMKLRRLGLVMEMSPVVAVQPGSPADDAGILVDDEIVAIDGEPVGDPIDLPNRLRRRAGETVKIEIRRPQDDKSYKTIEVSAQLTEREWFSQLSETMEISVLGIAYEVPATVTSVVPDSPASEADVRAGDQIVKVQLVPAGDEQRETEVENFGRLREIPIGGDEGISWPMWVNLFQASLPDTQIKLTVKRGDETHEVKILPRIYEDSFYPERGFVFVSKTGSMQATSIGEATTFAWRETKYALFAVYRFLHKLVAGQISPKLLGGPGTIAAVAGMSAKEGWSQFLVFLTLLSANLAVVNFLPIPVLDGGHMVFLILEAIFRRPVSERIVIPLTYAGLFVILGLMVFVISLDVNRFMF